MRGVEEKRAIARASLRFLGGTLLSRVSGLLRDGAMAFAFGTSPEVAAFMVAFRFSNLMRRLLGESALSASFIPHFESLKIEEKKSAHFFRDFFFSLFVTLIFVVIGAEGVSYLFVGNEIAHLTRYMIPGILFISLYGLSMGLLQCENRFFLAAVAPVGFNAVWALGALFLATVPHPFEGLSLCVTFAFCAQWLTTLPALCSILKRSLSFKEFFSFHLFSPEIRATLRPFFLGIVGIGAMQVNALFDAIFARFACVDGPAFLWYAIRLQQLPLALFGIGLSSALLPPLSRAIKEEQREKADHLLSYSLSRAFALLFPATLGLVFLGEKIIALLFGYGHFTAASVNETAYSLAAYSWGLVPAGWTLLIAPLFYAKKDYKTPMKGVLLSVGVNLALNALFVFGLKQGAESVACATSLSSFVNFFYLFKRWGGCLDWRALLKISSCGFLALLGILKGPLFIQMALFGAIYIIAASVLKAHEVLELLQMPRK